MTPDGGHVFDLLSAFGYTVSADVTYAGVRASEQSTHACADGFLGVSDLIGGRPDSVRAVASNNPGSPSFMSVSLPKITAIYGGGDWRVGDMMTRELIDLSKEE